MCTSTMLHVPLEVSSVVPPALHVHWDAIRLVEMLLPSTTASCVLLVLMATQRAFRVPRAVARVLLGTTVPLVQPLLPHLPALKARTVGARASVPVLVLVPVLQVRGNAYAPSRGVHSVPRCSAYTLSAPGPPSCPSQTPSPPFFCRVLLPQHCREQSTQPVPVPSW
jgi:hypothetical protein